MLLLRPCTWYELAFGGEVQTRAGTGKFGKTLGREHSQKSKLEMIRARARIWAESLVRKTGGFVCKEDLWLRCGPRMKVGSRRLHQDA